ncbi:Hypothetical protein PHPALM_2124 [Phytophthora palmivora]|uniref:Uncharacterized protein n=1 Tax=Phytophthora palmivora TaxID=4796 RepID=A0A2P4YQJ2_9STRA|nr:Hypothetical protein PHPALM_2124 [Phytophthora palmivora]
MLRVWRGSRPLVALVRGFAAVPTQPAVDAVAKRSNQSISSKRIGRKWGLHRRQFSYHVMIVSLSSELMGSKIDWLSNLGLSHDKINSMIVRSPSILGISLEKYDALVNWYLSHGISEDKIPYLFYIFPQGVSYSINENLDPKVAFLRDIGCDGSQVARILTTSVFIFRLSVGRLSVNVDYLVKLGVPREQLPAVLAIAPQYLALTPARIQEAVDTFDEMFGEGAGIRALMNSRILLFNIDGLRKSFDYLVSTVGLTPERLAKQVQLIGRSVDGILRPRFEFFQANDVKIEDLRDNVKWVSISNREFIRRYPDYQAYLAEYMANQKDVAHQS